MVGSALLFEAQIVAIYNEIDVFREPPNKPKCLGQGGPALEKQFRMPIVQPVVEHIETRQTQKSFSM